MTGAIKFTKQGYIKMGFQIVPQGVRLYAGDTGCGMTENEVNRVFNLEIPENRSFIQA